MIIALQPARKGLAVAVSAALLVSFLGCGKQRRVATPQPATPQPAQSGNATARTPSKAASSIPVGYTEEGIASWYGIPYHGRQAADGEIYDMETLVAAHRELPFNSWLKVTNLANGKTVVVRVIDRGPFVQGRILDLSKAAARQIELLGPGVTRIRLEVISSPVDNPASDFFGVQVGAFSLQANAERVRAEYAQRFGTAQVVVKQGPVPLWRVLVGKESSAAAAQQLADTLSANDKTVFVVRLDPRTPPVVTSNTPGEIAPTSPLN